MAKSSRQLWTAQILEGSSAKSRSKSGAWTSEAADAISARSSAYMRRKIDDAARARDEQIRELEREQLEKTRREAEEKEKRALKLKLDGSEEPELKKPESYQQRMERLIAEKQRAAREQALREREEAMRELEAWKNSEPKGFAVERLQLTPDAPSDPDEVVKKVDPEDLVIKGFAYDDLDMIHANTAQRVDVEEDFDLYAAMARKESEQTAENVKELEEGAQRLRESAEHAEEDGEN